MRSLLKFAGEDTGAATGEKAQGFLLASKPVSRILYPGKCGAAIIPLGPAFLPGSSNLPESRLRPGPGNPVAMDALRSGPLLLSYLVLLRVGFALPQTSLPARCALTLIPENRAAPFHPYPAHQPLKRPGKAVYFLWRFPCRRRTARRSGHPLPALAVSEHAALRSSDFPPLRVPDQNRPVHGAAIARLARARFMIAGISTQTNKTTGEAPCLM